MESSSAVRTVRHVKIIPHRLPFVFYLDKSEKVGANKSVPTKLNDRILGVKLLLG